MGVVQLSTARKKTDSKNRPSPKSPSKLDSKKSASKPSNSAGKTKETPKKKVVATKPVSKSAAKVVSPKVTLKSKSSNTAKPAVTKAAKKPEVTKAVPKTKPKVATLPAKASKAPDKTKAQKSTAIDKPKVPSKKVETKNKVETKAAPKPTKIHPPAKSAEKSATKTIEPAKASVVKPEVPAPKAKKKVPLPPPSNTKPEIVAKIRSAQAEKELRKDLAQTTPKPSLVPTTPIPMVEKGKDRLILMVRDAFWLHAHWDITRHSVERSKVSIAEHWHTAKPILRMIKIDDTATTSNAETVFRDLEIHGGVRNWYIEIETPGGSYKMLMGYLTSNGRFYELARSNTVTMPMPGGKESSDDHWADIAKNAEKVFALSGGYSEETNSGDLKEVFEERLKRTMDTDVLSQFGSGAEGGLKRNKQFHFNVDAELVVFGTTTADAHVNVGGEPVKVRNDGSFSVRLQFPDKRQVLRISAKSRDGVEEQTVVIAVERNTKVMEPLSLDADDL